MCITLTSVKQASELIFVFKQQGWPAGTQQILIPSTWQQMPGMSIHNPSQAVVPESPMGAPVPDPQQAPGWRWVQSDRTRLQAKMVQDVLQRGLITPLLVPPPSLRGRHGNQFDGINQQDCGASRHTTAQNHSSGAPQTRSQQGKRLKVRQGDGRARYQSSCSGSELALGLHLWTKMV